MEQWKAYPKLPDYQISSCGRVMSLKTNKILKQSTNNFGYNLVCLSNGKERYTSYIHRLVAETFIPTLFNTAICEVNHKDKNRLNNTVSNLEWSSPLENYFHGRIKIDTAQLIELTSLIESLNPSQISELIDFIKESIR
jgi:hypothetical protein